MARTLAFPFPVCRRPNPRPPQPPDGRFTMTGPADRHLDQIFAALRQRVPDIGYACYRAPLEAVSMRLPGIDEKTRREAWTRLVKATHKPYLG